MNFRSIAKGTARGMAVKAAAPSSAVFAPPKVSYCGQISEQIGLCCRERKTQGHRARNGTAEHALGRVPKSIVYDIFK
jgi:hypothetical protein